MDDAQIKEQWSRAVRLHGNNSSLAKRIAMLHVEELESAGVTEADIDGLYPLTPVQLWLRDEYVDAALD